jgi:flagellar hook assembly protein FlgD
VGQTSTYTFAVAVPSYIYDINQLAVVCFIQNSSSRQVEQAAFSISPVGISSQESSPSTIHLFPNPASSMARISFNLPNSSDVTINIYNEAGMLVRTEKRRMMTAGKQEVEIDVEMLADNIYIVELITGEMRSTTRLNVVH